MNPAVEHPLAVSVIVCTHNPRREYLDRVMRGLRDQTLSRDEWELLVVDNRSDVPVADIVRLDWHPRARVIREAELGLTAARLRGISETTGTLLVFVDDDNVLDADFLATALSVARSRDHLGSWSGQSRGEFEVEPPSWSRRYWGSLVIREFDANVWSNIPRLAESMPCGAGLCVRREVADYYRHLHESGKRTTRFDRTGESLASGGDNDLAACACALGMGMGLIAELRLTHLIPRERLTADYLARLVEGISHSSVLLDAEYGVNPLGPKPLRRIWEWVGLLLTPPPHRKILRAARRGRATALRTLSGRR